MGVCNSREEVPVIPPCCLSPPPAPLSLPSASAPHLHWPPFENTQSFLRLLLGPATLPSHSLTMLSPTVQALEF